MLWNNNYNIIESIDTRVGRGGVEPLIVDYLVVGGGGAGGVAFFNGFYNYGGGGAGGFVTGSIQLAFNVPFAVTIGGGGIVAGNNGQSSSFSGNNFGTPISLAAGGGFTATNIAGIDYHSAGGPQYNAGGSGSVCAGEGRYFGAGGGGGMQVGENAVCLPTARGGNGGAALAWYSGSFAGGGGGGVVALAGETNLGGSGGSSTNGRSGGNGSSFTAQGQNPIENSGGGGGGAGNNDLYPAQNGASGSVIIRYPYIPAEFGIPYATGGDKYIYDGYVYHRFNSNGTFTTFAR